MNFQYFIGNLTDTPMLRSKEGATPRVTFTLAISDGKDPKGKEKVHFLNFTAFGSFAENLLCLNKGTRLCIQARVDTYPKEVQVDGRDMTITMTTFIAVDGGPSMKWATVKVNRNESPSSDSSAASSSPNEDTGSRVNRRSSRVTEESDDNADRAPRERVQRDDDDEPRERTRRVRSRSSD